MKKIQLLGGSVQPEKTIQVMEACTSGDYMKFYEEMLEKSEDNKQ
ncbi:MAG: hypothetical protein ACI3WQ_10375 [Faecousia sp.]